MPPPPPPPASAATQPPAPRPFSSFPQLSAPTLAVLAAQGLTHATPVQEAVIPLLAGNADVAADAATGSGKTLAFVLPLVERLRRLVGEEGKEEGTKLGSHEVASLVLSPTRELAAQIHRVLAPFLAAAAPWASSALLVGGSDPAKDAARVGAAGAHVVVGTPGRTADALARLEDAPASSRRPLTWRSFDLLVLDEADRLLDAGFAAHVGAVLGRLPKQRRTGLFSATQTDAVAALARAGLRNGVRVRVSVAAAAAADAAGGSAAPHAAAPPPPPPPPRLAAAAAAAPVTPASLTVFAATVPVSSKAAALAAFLAEVVGRRRERVIVYFLTCACVDFYAAALPAALAACGGGGAGGAPPLPLPLLHLHGRMKQRARDASVAAFASSTGGAALLATDVAARGLDLPALDWTLQADAPQDPDAFVHRVGRSARAGRPGCALALLAPHEAAYAEFLRVRRVPLAPCGPPPDLFGGAGALEVGGGGRVGGGEAGAADAGAPAFSFPSAPAVNAALRAASASDRAVMEAGTRAFVSYVRGYREHRCRFIFRAGDLPLGQLAAGMGLLRLPRMPELSGKGGGGGGGGAPDVAGFEASNIDPEAVPYKDRAREKARRKRAAEAAAARAASAAEARAAHAHPRPPPTPAAGPPPPPAPERRLPAAKRRAASARQDEEDFAADYALLKKRRRGRISEADLEEGLMRAGGGGRGDGGDGDGEDLSDVDAGPTPSRPPRHQPRKHGGGRKGGIGRRGGGGFVPARR